MSLEDVISNPPFAPIVNLSHVIFTGPDISGGIASPLPAQFGPGVPSANGTFLAGHFISGGSSIGIFGGLESDSIT